MNRRLLTVLREFLSEVWSLIDADDGDVFQIQHIELAEELEQLLEEEENE